MVFPLVPQPACVQAGAGGLRVDARTRIVASPGTEAAASALAETIARRSGLILPWTAPEDEPAPGGIVLRRTDASDEAYSIVVAEDGAELAGSAAGLFYAVQTLGQLLTRNGSDRWLPAVRIDDAPRFGYRGVMLDVARTFFAVEVVQAFIDRASSLKFNHLHLHLSDDQGWRLQIESRPLLAERGGATAALGRPGGFYSRDDFRAIVAYAAERHMTVVPEIDLPGHTHAIGVAYPDLVEPPVLTPAHAAQSEQLGQPFPVHGEPYQGWAVGHSSVRIRHEETWELLEDVLREVAEQAPGPYLHVGGDEALGTPAEAFDEFVGRVTALTSRLGKTPIAWHEAGSAPVAAGTVGQYWGGSEPTADEAAKALAFVRTGGSLILSPSDVAYLDQKYDDDFPLGLSWAGPIDLRTAYGWEPTEIIAGLPGEAILGVEAPLWSETVAGLDDIDQLFLPRAAAIAEVAWSAPAAKDWDSFRERVAGVRSVWDAAGWGGHRPAEIAWPAR